MINGKSKKNKTLFYLLFISLFAIDAYGISIRHIIDISFDKTFVKAGLVGGNDLCYSVNSIENGDYYYDLYETQNGNKIEEECLGPQLFTELYGEKRNEHYWLMQSYFLNGYLPSLYQIWNMTRDGDISNYSAIGTGSLFSDISKDGRYIVWGEGASIEGTADSALIYDTKTRENCIIGGDAASGAVFINSKKLKIALADHETKTVRIYEKRNDKWLMISRSKKLPFNLIMKLYYLKNSNKILVDGVGEDFVSFILLSEKGVINKIYHEDIETIKDLKLPINVPEEYLLTNDKLLLFDKTGCIQKAYDLSQLKEVILKEIKSVLKIDKRYEIYFSKDLSHFALYIENKDRFSIYEINWIDKEK